MSQAKDKGIPIHGENVDGGIKIDEGTVDGNLLVIEREGLGMSILRVF